MSILRSNVRSADSIPASGAAATPAERLTSGRARHSRPTSTCDQMDVPCPKLQGFLAERAGNDRHASNPGVLSE